MQVVVEDLAAGEQVEYDMMSGDHELLTLSPMV
jgi:hypothetical protein